MLFKKKFPIEEYCTTNLATLFSNEREIGWEAFRSASNDDQLSRIDRELYYKHLRAVFIELMLVAITKNCGMDVSSHAHFCVMRYLNEQQLSDIDEIYGGYNRAFGSSIYDGVREMVLHFANSLTDGLRRETLEQLYVEFYGMLKVFTDDVKTFKLQPGG